MEHATLHRSILIVSRHAPAPNRSGSFAYLLDLMTYLAAHGCALELAVLDPWFDEDRLSPALRDIASVVIMHVTTPASQRKKRSLQMLLYPLYARWPARVMVPARTAWYRLRNRPIPGIRPHDAPATPKEIAFVRQRVAQFQPSVILANHTYLGNLFEDQSFFSGRLTAILTHHIESQRTHDFQRARLSVTYDSAWNSEQEQALLQHADLLIAIQSDDAALLRDMAPHSEIVVAPMSAQFIAHDSLSQIPGRCLFVGSNIDHNVHGLRWFLREIWPRVLQQQPHATVHVCGTVCDRVSETAPNVHWLGRVEQLAPEYGAAEVIIIPLLAGSGLKIKLIEALSHGRACVSTSVGVQGVRELANRAVLVADTPTAFATAVVTLLQQPEQRLALEAQARMYAHDQLAPERAYQPLLHRLAAFQSGQNRQKNS